jgi:hypothetical protein
MDVTLKMDVVAIKKLMVENQYDTICSLSVASGINRTTLGKILDGSIQPSADVMYKLIYALHIYPEQAGRIFFNGNLRIA